MPNLDAEVTMQDVLETARIVRCLDTKQWNPLSIFKRVRIRIYDV